MNIFASILVTRPSVCRSDNKHYVIKRVHLKNTPTDTNRVQCSFSRKKSSIIYVQRVYNILCCHLLTWLIFISSSVAPSHGTFENQPIPYWDSSFVSYNSLFCLPIRSWTFMPRNLLLHIFCSSSNKSYRPRYLSTLSANMAFSSFHGRFMQVVYNYWHHSLCICLFESKLSNFLPSIKQKFSIRIQWLSSLVMTTLQEDFRIFWTKIIFAIMKRVDCKISLFLSHWLN